MSDFKTLLSVEKFICPHFTKADESDTATQGAIKMEKEGVSCILVHNGKKLNGIVTESDIVRKVVAQGHNPKKIILKAVMTSQIIYIEADQSLFDARKIMEENSVRHLVVKNDGKIVGTIAAEELLGNL